MRRIVWIVVGLIVVAVLAFWLILIPMQVGKPQREAITATPASVGLAYQDVAFPSRDDKLTIRGWWMPAQNPRGILILVHGAGSNRQDKYSGGLPISAFLVKREHISVLSPDMRNHGTSDGSPDGRMTIGVTEARDVTGAIDFATAKNPGVPVYVLGASMGGATAIYAAAADKRIQRIVLIDPVLNVHSTSLRFVHATLHTPGWITAPIVWNAVHLFGTGQHAVIPLRVAANLKLPILLISDVEDPVCPTRFAHKLAARNSHVTLWTVPDPGPNTPGVDRSGFGTHTAAYRFHPDELKAKLDAFLQ